MRGGGEPSTEPSRDGSSINDTSSWQETVRKVQKYRDESIAKVRPVVPDAPSELPRNVTAIPKSLLTEREMEITDKSAEDLIHLLQTGGLTSVETTNAFLRRSAVAQKLSNCITELLPERALARAQELDDYFAKHQKPIGSLHGLPISLKEHLNMKDLDVNTSLCSMVGNKSKDDCVLLKLLWKAGAVFYARTTQPQTIMHLETSSNLYGVTVNPYNRDLTAGGSSGGEGALLALRGSCLGIGSDIGGSVRSPAANCGIFSLRPTARRVPVEGAEETMGGMEQVLGVFGPMSTSIEGIKRFMSAVLSPQPWITCPTVVPIPWRTSQEVLSVPQGGKKRLKIGVLWDDEVVKPHPPVTRALKETVERLKGVEGIELVDFTPLNHEQGWEIICKLFFGDGAGLEKQGITASGEPWRPLSHWVINENPHVKHQEITEVWHWTNMREDYRQKYAQHWAKTATGEDSYGAPTGMMDVLLCPVGPGAAPPLDCAKYWPYTSTWNLLDYPALVFPVTTVDPTVDLKDESYSPRNAQDKYNYDLYEPEAYRDAPVGLQLVGQRFEDEKVIAAFEIIQPHLKNL